MDGIQKALVLAPHPDDGEFGCGGTLKQLSDNGTQVWYIAFSPCKKSLPEGFDIFEELKRATGHLGIAADHVITYDFQVREFPQYRQAILEKLVQLRKDIQPELVLLPNSTDIHQDHEVIHAEGIRAFKHSNILGYELPWNNAQVTTNFYVTLTEQQLEAKIKAVGEYQSQDFRSYKDPEFFRSLARVRGVQANTDYAEGFELIRWSV